MEVSAPDGYKLYDVAQDFEITDTKTVTLEFPNEKLTSLVIKKVDDKTGEPLTRAKFIVEHIDGTHVGEYTTDDSGVINIPELPPDWYILREVIPPDGYLLDEEAKTVEVKTNVPTVVTFSNKKLAALEIIKIDEQSGQPLAGAKFAVEKQNGERIGEYTTDGTGLISIPALDPEWYVVRETKAPSGYLLDETPKIVEVKTSSPTVITFTNKKLTGLQIIKEDAATGEPLGGAKFAVEKQDGTRVGEYTTNNTGLIIIPTLDPGWYVVREISAPPGYILDETPKTVEVKTDVPTVVTFINKALSSIEIIKTDAVTNTPLAGAVFKIERVNGERIGDKYTTDIAGKIIVSDLSEGVYIISEIQAPANYVLDAQPQTVEVKTGKLTIAEFTNRPYPYLHIIKTDASTGELLSGAEFIVTNASGDLIAKVVSQASGPVSIKVAPGIYTVTEVKAPAGYELNDPVQTVEVRADGSAVYYGTGLTYPGNTAAFANRPLNSLEIVKLDSVTHNPLSGAIFSVDKSTGERIGDFRTDSAGAIHISSLTEGTYIISEVTAPTGYVLDDSPKHVALSGGRLVSETFLNKPLSGIQIVKLDSITQQPLADASFSVAKPNGESIGTFRTDTDGAVVIPGLEEGVYVVGELSAPNGYQLDETPKNVTVASGRITTVEFFNKPLSGIQILKTDAISHAPLANATFTVDRSTGERIGVYRTDAAGQILVLDLSEGTYIVSETAAPDGYQLDETPKTVTVVSGRVTTVEFTNKPHSGIQIFKTDAVSHAPLADATFTVDRSNGERIGIYKTDTAGQILVPDLEEGTYIVSETAAPDGYQLDETPKNVTVVSGRVTAVEFTNKPHSGIQIFKTDAVTHVPLANATFTVDRSNGERIGIYKTDAAGQILVPDLEEGTYIVSETAAPDGYMLDQIPKTVTVVSGRITAAPFTNAPYGSLVIKKTDEITGRPLAGAHFTVTHQGGLAVGDFITDNDGSIVVPNLEPGWYVVEETKSPNGYHLDSAAKTIEVNSHAPTAITFTNRPYSGIEITKTDADSHAPLAGATFTVDRSSGERIGTYKTDEAGKIIISDLVEC